MREPREPEKLPTAAQGPLLEENAGPANPAIRGEQRQRRERQHHSRAASTKGASRRAMSPIAPIDARPWAGGTSAGTDSGPPGSPAAWAEITILDTHLFRTSYQRNNKRGGQKNVRCFPICAGANAPIAPASYIPTASGAGHNRAGFCGRPVRAHVSVAEGVDPGRVRCFAEFRPVSAAAEPEGRFCERGAIVTEEFAQKMRKWRNNPQGLWFEGKALEERPADGSLVFEFNSERAGWHYGWRSNRFRTEERHCLTVMAFLKDDALLCLSTARSPPFRVVCGRRSKAADASPSRSETSTPMSASTASPSHSPAPPAPPAPPATTAPPVPPEAPPAEPKRTERATLTEAPVPKRPRVVLDVDAPAEVEADAAPLPAMASLYSVPSFGTFAAALDDGGDGGDGGLQRVSSNLSLADFDALVGCWKMDEDDADGAPADPSPVADGFTMAPHMGFFQTEVRRIDMQKGRAKDKSARGAAAPAPAPPLAPHKPLFPAKAPVVARRVPRHAAAARHERLRGAENAHAAGAARRRHAHVPRARAHLRGAAGRLPDALHRRAVPGRLQHGVPGGARLVGAAPGAGRPGAGRRGGAGPPRA